MLRESGGLATIWQQRWSGDFWERMMGVMLRLLEYVVAGVFGLTSLGIAALAAWLRSLWREDLSEDLARLASRIARAEEAALGLALGGNRRPVELDLLLRPATGDDPDAVRIAYSRIADVVRYWRDQKPERLVILGAAGTGLSLIHI